ncbi:hypothetical protein N7495_001824 [Penicillium taxi]|uniref:uncharacterized protein n=1 Tax=Penicillium taxi TaxID=168475 RepID=UPI0025458A87|nr:uncharacterized protein N7495_001824 [Penicillium taxi]KAJ5909142.1 hypothetical protein N7495_001824 [Penicillium taxi]
MTALVVWLLVGAAIFQRILGISFADALYFCDITVLTLGFGDVTASTAVGRGIIWPYATIGIIMLGLVVGSIHQFAREVHYDNVIRKHIEHKRQSTFNRSVTLADMEDPLIVMREEKDRFDAMRAIQYDTMRFRRWNDLFISIVVFGIVWSCGAVVFWKLEDITYFEGLYFCFCSLLTIGYGDFTPQSNAGRPFFVMWSLIAIPTMTMLISQMSDTVVAGFKTSTETFANYFVMPQASTYKEFLGRVPFLMQYIQRHEEKKRLSHGFEVGTDIDDTVDPEDEPSQLIKAKQKPSSDRPKRTIEELAKDSNPSPYELAQQLAFAIRSATQDSRGGKRKRYSYEEWVEFTRLIQFTDPKFTPNNPDNNDAGLSIDKDEYGVLNWDWIGENSPLLAQQTEPEWVLDRLCESLIRFVSTLEQGRAAAEGEEPTLRKEQDLGIEEF